MNASRPYTAPQTPLQMLSLWVVFGSSPRETLGGNLSGHSQHQQVNDSERSQVAYSRPKPVKKRVNEPI